MQKSDGLIQLSWICYNILSFVSNYGNKKKIEMRDW